PLVFTTGGLWKLVTETSDGFSEVHELGLTDLEDAFGVAARVLTVVASTYAMVAEPDSALDDADLRAVFDPSPDDSAAAVAYIKDLLDLALCLAWSPRRPDPVR